MRNSRPAFRGHVVPAIGLLAISGTAASADSLSWLERIDAYASAGIGEVRARPDTGGNITITLNDNTTVGIEKSMVGGSGRATDAYLPVLQLGARFQVIEDLTVGIEGQYFSFSDSLSTVPLDAPGTTPLPTFGTYRETSLFDLKARDIAATVAYSRWGATAEAVVGLRDASFGARSEMEAFGVITSGNFLNLALSNGSYFKGDGAVFGLRLSYLLPQIPLRVIAGYTYAKLDGKSDSFGRSIGTVVSNPSTPLSGAATVTRNGASSKGLIHDQEYGLQYEFNRGQSFARLSWMEKSLEIDGPPTGGAGFGGTIGDLTTNSFSAAGLGEGKVNGTFLTLGIAF
jgi:hypothetical protein